MDSVRHRMSSLLRRSSLIGKNKDKDADSSSERDSNSRPGSPSPSLRRGSGEAGSVSKRRKRVSFSSFRQRSGTADGAEHSQLAKEVVNSINADSDKPQQEQHSSSDEPVVAVVALPAEAAAAEQAKTESSLEAASLTESKEHPIVPVEETVVEEVVEPVIQITEVQTEVVPVVEHVNEHIKTENVETNELNEVQVSSTIITRDSPSHSMVNIAVVEPAPAFPEPATYDTSFTSTSSSNPVPTTNTLPLAMPVPRPLTGQPLSAIDELRAKGHPVTDWTQKDDVNYDADADEYVKVMSLFFLLPAVLFLGLPYLFSYPAVLELASM